MTLRMRPLLRQVLPAPARSRLWQAKSSVEQAARLARWRSIHVAQLVRFARRRRPPVVAGGARLENHKPNSGPVPMTRRFESARVLVAAFDGASRRSQGGDAFEGFAPDDAIYDPTTQAHEFWSNVPLAGYLAAFGYRLADHPSILELGCGAAHLSALLRRYGITDYVGVDGNPYFMEFSPHVAGHAERFCALNLQQEIQLARGAAPLRFDIVCSFEVAEHIREERIDEFLRTIRNHMHASSTAFVTASLQADLDVHVLVKSRAWWLNRFARSGLVPRDDAVAVCRQLARHHPWNWNATNTNVFALRAVDQKEKSA